MAKNKRVPLLKGFFRVKDRPAVVVHTRKPDAGDHEEDHTYAEVCEMASGPYGYVTACGWIKSNRLEPLRNDKAGRNLIRTWAKAKRKGVKASEAAYQLMKQHTERMRKECGHAA